MLRTVSNIARISSFEPCTLIPYFFRIATPNSNPSIESSPSPLPNKGSSLSMSSGVTSSRLSALTMSSFTSRSRSATIQPHAVVRFQVRYQFARAPCTRLGTQSQKFAWIDLVRDLDSKNGTRGRNLIVWLALHQRDRFASNRHGLQTHSGESRNMCESPLKVKRLAGHRTGTFRKDNEVVAACQRLAALLD